jgi:hypothetical protein
VILVSATTATPKAQANEKVKDTLFTKLFSEPDAILSLYNALSQSQYPPETPIEITTLRDVFFKGRHNDLSFIVDGKLVVLVEHQSTINPNMPIRMLIYLGKVYDSLLKGNTIYKSKLVKLLRPEFIVLYNGKDKLPAEDTLKLSDAFVDLPSEYRPNGNLELTVRVLNVNMGYNENIVQKSVELNGFVAINHEIRKNRDSGMNINEAVAKAVKDCADRNILSDFLRKYGSEVINMLNTEWNLDEYVAVQREEAVEDKALDTALSLLQEGDSPEKVARCTKLPLERVQQLQA